MDDNCWRILLKEQNNNCRRWLSEFDPDVIAIYNCLAQAPRLTMNLKKQTQVKDVNMALSILSDHGIIDADDPDAPQKCRNAFSSFPKVLKKLKMHKNTTIEKSKFIQENSHIFWWIPEHQKINISTEALVENILNHGDEKSVVNLFHLLGIERVADIFFKQIASHRNNYFPQVKHFFTLYFKRHVQNNTD